MACEVVPGRAYDAVVIGGGAAGLSAALVLARALRRVAVIDAGEPRNSTSGHLHGFLSREGMPPGELLEAGREEVRRHGGEVLADRVNGAVRCGAVLDVDTAGPPIGGPDGPAPDRPAGPVRLGFEIRLARGEPLYSRRLLVSTGCTDRLPAVPGIADRWGIDVLHCPYCDGWEVRDRRIGVLGTGDLARREALMLRQWSADVVLVRHDLADLTTGQREELAARGVGVVEGRARRLVADDRLVGVELEDGTVVDCAALFVTPEPEPNDRLLRDLGCARDDRGWIPVGEGGTTSVPGVLAAGNVVDPALQIVSAIDAGSRAALALNADLIAEDLERAVHGAG